MVSLSIELNPEKQEDVLNEIDEKDRPIFYFSNIIKVLLQTTYPKGCLP
jgi:hypothetical protein